MLFACSYDYVGDLAETVALIWPADPAPAPPPDASPSVVETLRAPRRPQTPAIARSAGSTRSTPTGRWALLKLITGGLRVGVSARLAKPAARRTSGGAAGRRARGDLARPRRRPTGRCSPGCDGRAPAQPRCRRAAFRPLMLAHPLDEADLETLDPADFARRVEMGRHPRAARRAGGGSGSIFSRRRRHLRRLSRHPRRDRLRRRARRRAAGRARRSAVAPFADLQQRPQPQDRRRRKLLTDYPAACPPLRHAVRRARTCARCPSTSAAPGWRPGSPASRASACDLSPLIPFAGLGRTRRAARRRPRPTASRA